MYLRILCKIHVSDSCLSIFIPQGPLQDPCLWIHVSTSICISGTSARSMSPDPYLSIHMYLKLLCKIHVSGSVYKHPFVSQDPLRDPCLRFMSQHPHVSQEPLLDPCLRIRISASICISGSSARSMSPIHVSASIYLRVLCKIHVFGFMSQYLPISGFSARSMCPIHVLAFMSQHLYISGSSARSMSRLMSQHLCISGFSTRSMSSDSCLSIH